MHLDASAPLRHARIGAGLLGVVRQLRAAMDEDRGQRMLQAELGFQLGTGQRPIAEAQRLGIAARLDPLDACRLARRQLRQRVEHGIDGWMRVAAGRPGLEAGLVDQPVRLFGHHRRRISVRRGGREQALLALQDPARATHAGGGQLCRQPAAARGLGVVQRLGRHRLMAHLPQAAGAAAGIAQRIGAA